MVKKRKLFDDVFLLYLLSICIYLQHILNSYIHMILFVSPLMVGDLVRRSKVLEVCRKLCLLVGEIGMVFPLRKC